MRRLADIVQELVPVIGPERDAPMRIAAILARLLLFQQSRDHRNHVGIAAEMIGFHE
jgi:hypothetical protein